MAESTSETPVLDLLASMTADSAIEFVELEEASDGGAR